MKYLVILFVLFPTIAFAQYKTSNCDGKCGKDQVCVLNDDGFYYCTKAPKCTPSCPKGEECKSINGIPTCVPMTSPNPNPNIGVSPNPNPNKCIPPCPKGQKCVEMEDGSYECFPIINPNPDPNIGINPNPDPNALPTPETSVPQHNCRISNINYSLIIIILLVINIILTFKIYRRR